MLLLLSLQKKKTKMMENQNLQCPRYLNCHLVVVIVMEVGSQLKLRTFMVTAAAVIVYAQTIKLKISNASDAYQSNAVSSVSVFSLSVLQLGKFLITSSLSSMISLFGGTQLLLLPF
jgi:hypothetical protein